ncbi:MAG: hypothetical protein PsegKO_27020 [Pseudohongiellaceae bacterium]
MAQLLDRIYANSPASMATRRRASILVMFLALWMLPPSAMAADADSLLSISGDRIDYVATPATQSPAETIARYYGQLAETTRQRLQEHRTELESLLGDYRFAMNAADTAEMNSILSKVTAEWVYILRVHNDEFTDSARAHLRQLYGRVYPALAAN